MRVCVIVPMYNEEAIARASIETIFGYVKHLPPIATLLIVNDGSRDRTGEIVGQLVGRTGNNNQLQMISHTVNKGYGAAIRTGIKFAIDNDYNYAIFMDSDLTNHPKYLKTFYEKMLEGWDYIKATRYSKGGGVKGVGYSYLMRIAALLI